MKKNTKKFKNITTTLLLCTAFLSGCGSSSEDEKTTAPSPVETELSSITVDNVENLLSHATQTMNNLDSISSVLDVEINMAMMGQQMLSQTITTANNFLDPTKLHLSMDIITADAKQNIEMYVEEENDSINTYLLSTNDEWIYEAIPEENLTSLLAHKQATDILTTLQNPYISDEFEDENGVTKYTVIGELDYNSMIDVAIANGTLATAEMLGMSIEDLENIVKSMDNLEVALTIGSNGLVYEYKVDMYLMLQGLMDVAMEKTFGIDVNSSDFDDSDLDLRISVSKAYMKITTSNFNNVEDFNVPASAKK